MYFVYFDLETTGVNTKSDRIVEIAAYIPALEKEFQAFVNPGIPIPQEAANIHGITDEMVKDAPPWKEVVKDFFAFIGEDPLLIAHNGQSFDLPLLKEECARINYPFNEEIKMVDSLKWARQFRSDIPRHGLQFLREIYDIPANQAHRALDDVKVLAQVFSFMVDDLTPELVFNISKERKILQKMPFGKHQGMPLKQLPAHYLRWLKDSGALEREDNLPLKISLESLALI